MLSRDQLPDDAADWTQVEVSFPHLADNRPNSCPISSNELMDYIHIESADLDDADPARLLFTRTAKVDNVSYWLWTYTESDGELCYILFRLNPNGSTLLGLSGTNGLSPEQYLLADYYGEIYWS